MFIHLRIPGFHAAIHQACAARLRGRPVAVAVDGSDHAPLFATSVEARAEGIWPGWRSAPARRRCPELIVVTPDPDLYRRGQRAAAEYAATATPRVGGRAGALDLDLAGTEPLWSREAGTANPVSQATWWARTLRQRVEEGLRLPTRIGVSQRLLIARLAARAADGPDGPLALISPGAEEHSVSSWPIRWLPDLGARARQALADCGLVTLGDLWRLGTAGIEDLLGAEDAAPLAPLLTGIDEPLVPLLTDPEPEITVTRHCGDRGAAAACTARLVAGMARDLGFRLREQGLACSRLTVAGAHLDGRSVTKSQILDRQLRHDEALGQVAQRLVEPLSRRVSWQRLYLTASGLCTAEDQQELFAAPKGIRLERAKDHLRARFGDEMVQIAATG